MGMVPEIELEVEVPTDVQVTPEPDENKYYMRGGELDHPVFVQSDQSNQSHVKSPGGSRAVWVLALITVVCQAVAAGGGLGVGLHKPSSSRSVHFVLLIFRPFALSNPTLFSVL